MHESSLRSLRKIASYSVAYRSELLANKAAVEAVLAEFQNGLERLQSCDEDEPQGLIGTETHALAILSHLIAEDSFRSLFILRKQVLISEI